MHVWKRKFTAIAIAVVFVPMAGCSLIQENPRAAKGTAIGAVAGAATGAGLGALAGGGRGAAIGAGIGAGIGALGGGLIGHYLDNQARDLEQIVGAQQATNDRVTRAEDAIQMTLSSDTLFDTGKATLYPGQQDRLVRIAQSLNRYERTSILVVGHTDSVGSAESNQRLSDTRAQAVRNVLVNAGVNPARISTRGDGENSPMATNATPEGRVQNRRVELLITPNAELRREAEQAASAPPAANEPH
jgi:outer membrane protein OmpA-like peptidoglycan-associated protein